MSDLETIFKKIDGYRDEIIEFQGDLTSRVALGPANGGTGEHEKADFLKRKLEDLKPDDMEEVKAPDEHAKEGYRPNLVARFKGVIESPTVWVLSHMDIVPPGDPTLWGTDPYRITIEGDKIIGRGVEDNQHGIVSSYMALKAIKQSCHRSKMPVGLAFVADEETGSRYGLEYLLKTRQDLFHPDDLIIVPDGGNADGTMIEVAEKSMLWLKFTVTGKQCHASTPDRGKNSLFGAARLIIALEQLKKDFDLADEMFSPKLSTFEPTKIEANVPNVNTIPGKDVFYLDCRILPSYEVDHILTSAKGIAAGIAKELGLSIEIEPVYREDSVNPTPSDAPVVKALAKAIHRVKGLEAKPMGIGGGTVASFFRRAGLPAAVWLTTPGTEHQPNEYCLVSNLISDAKAFACVYMGFP
ncbi:MAG: M20 family metallo-hydrolase [Deltaproteobacteria bacterium]|nr:M20 family metallo-hydrolase [Deltaproteobacteria bacterium]